MDISKRPFFISEIGLNHNGDVKIAQEMIIKSAQAGAHGVKFQTFIPEKMNSIYTKDLLERGQDSKPDSAIIDFLQRFVLPEKELRHLQSVAELEGVVFFSAPFDLESLELLESLNVPLFKIASGEITNLPLLRALASKKKPVILSTGMSNREEIGEAIGIFNEEETPISLLHCVSLYPTEDEDANLERITSLKRTFHTEVGLSDHSKGIMNSIIAASLGATIFEKHFILHENHECPDKQLSLTPEEFKEMVQAVTRTMIKLGNGEIHRESGEREVARAARRSIFAAEDIKNGEVLTMEKLKFLRPGTGISVNMLDEIIGKRVNRELKENSMLRKIYIED